MAYYLKKHCLPLWKTTDVFAPSLAVGQSLGRIGCFFAGCCYGKVCDLPWAITFTDPKSLAPTGTPLHPTQLYEALATFMIFLVLLQMGRGKKFDGQVTWMYVLLYSISRIATEQFRGDPMIALPEGLLSVSQWIATILIGLSVGMLVYLGRRKPQQPPG
jgi:phosphatidylglycerol:prolipoprotein diacylglycerol transferase